MKKILILLVIITTVGSARSEQKSEPIPFIHPKIFSMVESWLSDTAFPVVTEINLDAVKRNGNQFYGSISTNGPWIRAGGEDGREYMRYRFLGQQGGTNVVVYQYNGGGSMTTQTRIGFILTHRTLEIEGVQKQIQVLRVESVQSDILPEDKRDVPRSAR